MDIDPLHRSQTANLLDALVFTAFTDSGKMVAPDITLEFLFAVTTSAPAV